MKGKNDYILPQTLMREMLDNACGNPVYPENFDFDPSKHQMVHSDGTRKNYIDPPGGWYEYRIETHCLAFIIVARKKHNRKTGKRTWQIRSFTTEDC